MQENTLPDSIVSLKSTFRSFIIGLDPGGSGRSFAERQVCPVGLPGVGKVPFRQDFGVPAEEKKAMGNRFGMFARRGICALTEDHEQAFARCGLPWTEYENPAKNTIPSFGIVRE